MNGNTAHTMIVPTRYVVAPVSETITNIPPPEKDDLLMIRPFDPNERDPSVFVYDGSMITEGCSVVQLNALLHTWAVQKIDEWNGLLKKDRPDLETQVNTLLGMATEWRLGGVVLSIDSEAGSNPHYRKTRVAGCGIFGKMDLRNYWGRDPAKHDYVFLVPMLVPLPSNETYKVYNLSDMLNAPVKAPNNAKGEFYYVPQFVAVHSIQRTPDPADIEYRVPNLYGEDNMTIWPKAILVGRVGLNRAYSGRKRARHAQYGHECPMQAGGSCPIDDADKARNAGSIELMVHITA